MAGTSGIILVEALFDYRVFGLRKEGKMTRSLLFNCREKSS
jgi:hypothetical protein